MSEEEFDQKDELQTFSDRIKEELKELGLIKQQERLKITRNTKGLNFEYSLLGKVEEQLDRMDNINRELGKRLDS